MISVAVVDRHPTVRAGLDAILGAQPDMVAVGGAADGRELAPLLQRARPDVVLLDAQPLADALALCLRLRARLLGPRVVLFSAGAPRAAIVPATLAGADGLVDKAADVRELLDVVRAVARGERALPRVTPRLQSEAALRLAPRDHAIFAMRLAGTSPRDIAATLGLSRRELEGRSAAILEALSGAQAPPAAAAPPAPVSERAVCSALRAPRGAPRPAVA